MIPRPRRFLSFLYLIRLFLWASIPKRNATMCQQAGALYSKQPQFPQFASCSCFKNGAFQRENVVTRIVNPTKTDYEGNSGVRLWQCPFLWTAFETAPSLLGNLKRSAPFLTIWTTSLIPFFFVHPCARLPTVRNPVVLLLLRPPFSLTQRCQTRRPSRRAHAQQTLNREDPTSRRVTSQFVPYQPVASWTLSGDGKTQTT